MFTSAQLGKWLWLTWAAILSGLVLTSWVILGIGVDKQLFLGFAELSLTGAFFTLLAATAFIVAGVVKALEPGGVIYAVLHDDDWDYRSWMVLPSVTERWRLCAIGLGAVCVGMSVLVLSTLAAALLQICLLYALLFYAAVVVSVVVLVATLVLGGIAIGRWLFLQCPSPDGPKD